MLGQIAVHSAMRPSSGRHALLHRVPSGMDIVALLTVAVRAGTSALHLKSGNFPTMRLRGVLRPLGEQFGD